MRRLFLMTVIVLPVFVSAQDEESIPSGGIISGEVKDSTNQFPLQSVTVTVFKAADTSLLDFRLTTETGGFDFQKLPLSVPLLLRISSAGYKTYQKNIKLDSTGRQENLGAIFLSRGYEMLDEAVVSAILPIRMNGDTLEINPAAFKMDSSAVVEDMLRKVPGVTLWGDGTITVNGLKVNNVFVDGKPFFGNDPAIATQNLPKNAIEKIQVYQEVDPTKDESELTTFDSTLTMNIKLKPGKHIGYFGKAGAGYGTDDRYEADLSLQGFNKKSRLSLGAMTNNINKSSDLRGLQSQGTFRSFNRGNNFVANFGGRGVSKIGYVGGQFQHNFMDNPNNRYTDELNINGSIQNIDNLVTTETFSQNSASGTVFTTNRNSNNNSIGDSYNADIRYDKRDIRKDLSFSGSLSQSNNSAISSTTSEAEREGDGVVSKSDETTTNNSKNNKYNLGIRYRNIDNEETNLKAFSINYNLDYSNSESDRKTVSSFISTEDALKNTYYDRLYNNDGSNINQSVGLNYNALKRLLFGNARLADIRFSFSYNARLSTNNSNSLVSDYDSTMKEYIVNDYLTNTQKVTRFENGPSINISKRFNKALTNRFSRQIQLSTNLRGQFISENNESNISYRNIDRKVNLFSPKVSFDYDYDRKNRYRVKANVSQQVTASVPTINQLYPIVDSTSLYSFNYGNPFLKNSRTYNQSAKVEYNTTNRRKKLETSFGMDANWNVVQNAVSDSSNYDSLGRRAIYLINVDGHNNYSVSFNTNNSLRMGENNVLQFRYSVSYNGSKSPNYIDGIYSIARSNGLNNNLNVFLALGDWISFSVGQTFSFNNSRQSGKNLSSLKSSNYVTNANINLSFPRNVTWGSTINFVNNRTASIRQDAVLWNAFTTIRFLKSKQAELKFSAMDLLRQNKNISINSDANSLTTTVTNGLQQFYMLTISYYPRQFGGRSKGGMRGGENRGMMISPGLSPGGFQRRGGGGGGRRF